MEFRGIPRNLEFANFADTSSSMEFHGIPWKFKCANFADMSSFMEFHGTCSAPISIYIYIYCWKSPNWSHLYDHGFHGCNTNRQAVCKSHKIFDYFSVIYRLPDDWYYIHETMVVQMTWVWTFSTMIAIIRACACWAIFVLTLTNTVHLIYIYIYIYIYYACVDVILHQMQFRFSLIVAKSSSIN